MKDIPTYEAIIRDLVKVDLTCNQYGALLSFVYNIGRPAFAKSSVRTATNNRRWKDVVAALQKYVKAGKPLVTLPGLVTRRKDEGALFSKPDDTVCYRAG